MVEVFQLASYALWFETPKSCFNTGQCWKIPAMWRLGQGRENDQYQAGAIYMQTLPMRCLIIRNGGGGGGGGDDEYKKVDRCKIVRTKRFNFPSWQYLFNSRNKRSGVKIWICAKYKQQLPFLLYLPLFCDIYSALDFTAIHQHLGHYKNFLRALNTFSICCTKWIALCLFGSAFSHK